MSSQRKMLHHYNIPGHAHELTFSCYRSEEYFLDPVACEIFLLELGKAKDLYNFRTWAYVVMPTHVHLLIWPRNQIYSIGKIESGIKGVMSKKYGKHLQKTNPAEYRSFLIKSRGLEVFRFWQPGGGFDRNLWNGLAVHDSINYIEANPVRNGLCGKITDWKWSSAYARHHKLGVEPDFFQMPPLMINPQRQRIGVM